MSERKVSIEQMAEAVMDGLIEYAGLATDVMKDCVTKAGNTVKTEVKANAPVRTGQYKKGWAVKKQKETANALELVVHNKKRYQLTHLLEKGHAKRGGGRVRAFPHIAPAEQAGIRELEEEQRLIGLALKQMEPPGQCGTKTERGSEDEDRSIGAGEGISPGNNL